MERKRKSLLKMPEFEEVPEKEVPLAEIVRLSSAGTDGPKVSESLIFTDFVPIYLG